MDVKIKSVSKEEFNEMLKKLPENMSVASTVLIDNFKERIFEMDCHDITEEFVGAFYNSDLIGLIWFPEDDEIVQKQTKSVIQPLSLIFLFIQYFKVMGLEENL